LKLTPFFILFFFCFRGHGQEETKKTYSSFSIDNKEVVWIQIYHVAESRSMLKEQVLEFLKRKAWISNITTEDNELFADLKNFRVDYKRYGGKYMNTSNLIRSGKWTGKVRISFKEKKYRVIVYALEYDAQQPAMHAGKMSNKPHKIHGTWTNWVLNNYRSQFRRRRHTNMDLMHFQLKDAFTLTATESIDDHW
jgi:ribosomal protein S8